MRIYASLKNNSSENNYVKGMSRVGSYNLLATGFMTQLVTSTIFLREATVEDGTIIHNYEAQIAARWFTQDNMLVISTANGDVIYISED